MRPPSGWTTLLVEEQTPQQQAAINKLSVTQTGQAADAATLGLVAIFSDTASASPASSFKPTILIAIRPLHPNSQEPAETEMLVGLNALMDASASALAPLRPVARFHQAGMQGARGSYRFTQAHGTQTLDLTAHLATLASGQHKRYFCLASVSASAQSAYYGRVLERVAASLIEEPPG